MRIFAQASGSAVRKSAQVIRRHFNADGLSPEASRIAVFGSTKGTGREAAIRFLGQRLWPVAFFELRDATANAANLRERNQSSVDDVTRHTFAQTRVSSPDRFYGRLRISAAKSVWFDTVFGQFVVECLARQFQRR